MNFPRDPHLLRYGVGRSVSYRLIMSIKGEHMENDTEKNILAFLLFSFSFIHFHEYVSSKIFMLFWLQELK